MKILHTSDWHLGKRLERFSRHEEQVLIINQICDIAENEAVDVIIIAGDLFDTFSPPAESIDIFYKALKRLANEGKRPVIAIAGNHDSSERIDAPDPLARECGIIFAGAPFLEIPLFQLASGLQVTRQAPGFIEAKLPNSELLRLIITPYANEYRMKRALGTGPAQHQELRKILSQRWKQLAEDFCDNQGVNILTAHLFMMNEKEKQMNAQSPERSEIQALVEPEGEKPILHLGGLGAFTTKDLPQNIQYAALGHLHRNIVVREKPYPVVYSGSPLGYSFSEAGQEKFVNIIEVEPGRPAQYRPVKLSAPRPLYRKQFEGVEKAAEWLNQNPDALVELTIVSDSYLSGADRRKLLSSHEGIITIIPHSKAAPPKDNKNQRLDLTLDRETLFKSYFLKKKEIEPGPEIIQLFREILATEERQ